MAASLKNGDEEVDGKVTGTFTRASDITHTHKCASGPFLLKILVQRWARKRQRKHE